MSRLPLFAAGLALVALLLVVPAGAQTGSLTPGVPLTLDVATAGDTATATFQGTAGERISLLIADVTIGTSACCSTKVSLVRPDGRTLASVTVGTNGGFLDAATLPLDGTYEVVVDPSSTSTGSATLTLYDVPPDVTGAIVPGGAPVDVSLGTPGQNAELTFDGTAGQRVSVQLTNVSIGTSICCSTALRLVKPDGKTLTSASAGTNGGFLDTTTLPTSGTYRLVVDPQGVNAGAATATVHDVPADAPGTLVAGGPAVTVTTGTPGQNAALTFAGAAGQRISLEIGPICCTTRVLLLKPDGKMLTSTTAAASGGFFDTTTLPTTGTYTVVLDPQGAATGELTVRLHDVPPDATGTIVPGGPPVDVTTTTPGQNARVTFDGTAGQRVSLEVGPSCCTVRVSILKPNGSTLASPLTIAPTGGFVDAVTLTHTGTHTIVLDPFAAAAGTVTLTLYDVPPDTTTPITPGGAPVTVTTDTAGQNAKLSFSGTSGQRVALKIGPTCCTTRITLLRSNGSTVATTFAGTGGGFMEPTTLPVSGDYVILVDIQGGATGSVTLTLYDVPADVTGTITPGGPQETVTTTTPGQNAELSFSGTAGQRVSLRVTDACCTTSVSLLRPDGTTLKTITTFGAGGFMDTVALPSNGSYAILVNYQGAATGSVTLALYDVPPDATATIAAGGPSVIVSLGTPGQNGRVTFSGNAGQRVTLRLSNVTVGSSSFSGLAVSVLEPDGSTLVAPVLMGTNGGTVDTTTLPVTGTYTILVDPQGPNTGSMTLELDDVPGDVTATIVPGGAPVSVSITSAGQNARLSFAGTAGQRVSLTLSDVTIGTSTCCSTKVSILEPDGTTLVAPVFMGSNGGFLDATTLPVTGTYEIFVDPQGSDTGNATLTLYDVAADAAATALPGGAPATATTTTPGQNAAVTFAGTAGQRVSVRVGPVCCITRISIAEPDGSTLVAPSSFGTGGGFIDTQVLPATGTYTIFLDPFGAATGSFTLTVYDVPPDVAGSLAIGSSLTLTTTVPGQNGVATLAGSAGDGLKLVVGPFNCCSTRISILEPGGGTLVAPTAFNPDGGVVLTGLPTTGTYTILVDPQGAGTGQVHLAAELDNTAPAPPTLTMSESAPDSHIVGATLFFRPSGAGGTFTVTATSSDGGTGLARVRFPGLASGFTPTSAVDDTASPYTQTYSWGPGATYDNPSNPVTAFDRVGNTASTPFAVTPDSAPPTTSDNTTALGSAWKNTTQIVVLSPNDGGGAGAAITYFTSDGSTPTTASTQGTSVSLATDGVYTVKYFSVDHVGNAEPVRTAGTQIRIDKTPPSSATLDPLPSVIKNGQVLTGSGSDALSGLASIQYLSCAGASCTPTTPIGQSTNGPTYPVTWSSQPADGTYQVVARVRDAAGNTLDSAKRTVVIDNTAPNTTITAGPPNPTNATTASFSFTSTEAGSTFECRLDGGAFTPCTSPTAYSGLAAGSHTFEARATDPIGNTDATPASRSWTIDLTPPDTTITSTPADPTNSTTPSFGFTSTEAGSTFQCSLDGGAFTACTSPKSYSGLTAGAHTFQVRATDPAGNTDPTPASYAWTVDLTAPDTTLTSFPPTPTNSTSASFAFTSEPGTTFECRLDGGTFAACTSPKSYTGLTSGSHTFEVRALDPAGNADPTPASYTWTVDTGPPETSLTAAPADPTNATSATFEFTSSEAGSTFECALDGGAFTACTSPTAFSGLAPGSYTFQVRATDSAGNTDPTPASYTWTVDLTPPETAITSAPADPSSSTAPSFSVTSTETGGTFECALDGGAFAACTNPKSYTGLAPGSHTFQVRATDPAGNTDPTPAAYTWTVDTAPPDTTITSAPAGPTNATSASFEFAATEAGSTFECSLDGGAFAACTSPKSYTGLASGSHTFQVRAVDPAGNPDPSPASHAWTVDTGAPETTITSAPADPTNATSATFEFTSSEAGSTFECALDGAPFTPCTSPKSYGGLAAGGHTFQVRATDPAGNTDPTPAAYTWTVDLTAPDTTVTSGPADPTSATSAIFEFTSSEAGSTFECALDGGPFTPCASPKSYSGLAPGSHTFQVRATDPAGNTDSTPAAYTWTLDTSAPETAITSAPADPTNATDATFTFTAEEAGSTFACELDGNGFAPCSGATSYSGLGAGSHTFRVRATDPAGNTDPTPAAYTWTVDTGAPQTTVVTGPADPTNETTATFEFVSDEAGSTFECALDGGAFAACTSPKSYSGLAPGSHTFQVRATDPAGNTDATPATYTWTVDGGAPETTITSGPADPTNATSATFEFTSDEAGSTFECALDGAPFSACASPQSYSGLAPGSHTFQVRATDPAGNTDPTPASSTWTVDQTAPDTTITSTPPDPTSSTSASLAFTSEPGATFECRLDGAPYEPCVSPKTYTGLGAGSHTFQVRATDTAGNTDPTPAAYSWVLDLTAPETTITSGPSAATTATTAAFEFSANEAGSTFECSLDGAAFATCTSPATYTDVAEGSHAFEARATDPAGNTDATPATRTWTVDLTAPAAPVVESPADGSTSNTGTFTVSGTAEPGSTVELFDGSTSAGTTSASTGGTWAKALVGVADGSHTYTAKATDAAGNASAASNARTVVVDTTAPNTTITTGPLGSTASTLASFTFAADDPAATFECRLDGAAFASCTSPKSYSGLAEGPHSFEVRATDAAGNTDPTPAVRSWTVDVTPPAAPTIASPSDGAILSTSSVTVSGTAEPGSSVEVFDGVVSRGFASTSGSGTWSRAITGVTDGSHTYTAKASDNAGNVSPSSNAVTIVVDTTAPQTTVESGPSDPTTDTSATFAFSADEAGSTFECRLDVTFWEPCTSPHGYTGLAPGAHTFDVRATDAAGNTDPSPASFGWSVT